MPKPKAKTVTEYITHAPKAGQKSLRELRAILKKVAPKATEAIKWGSPVFEEKRILFAFSAFESYLNFMPTRSTLKPFKKELTKYTTGKDTIRFPYDKPLPKALIRKIALYRLKEVREDDSLWMKQSGKSKNKK